MKTIAATLIISVLTIASIVLVPSTSLQASSRGLKLYLTVDTNMYDQDITIYTNQYGYEIYRHSGFMYTGINEYTLNFPRNLVENGPFEICIDTDDVFYLYCGDGHNSEERRPESVFISAYIDNQDAGLSPDNSQGQSRSENQDQSQSQSQNNEQTTTIINCPANSKCVIEQ